MISHITISLNDAGVFVLNLGDVTILPLHDAGEVRRWVGYHLGNLGYFPQGNTDLNREPLSRSVLKNLTPPAKKPPKKGVPDDDD